MRIVCLYFLLLVQPAARGQFSDSVRHYIKLNSTGVLNQTSSGTSYVLSNALNFSILRQTVALNTAANWVYGVNQQALTNNDLSTHADLNFFRQGNKLSYWMLVNFDKTYSLGINYRVQAGAGLSYNFIDSPFLRINISDGILYENGNIKDITTARNSYSTPRNSFRLLYRWQLANKLTITGIHFYQPSLQSLNDYIIQSTSNISVKLYHWLNLVAAVTYNKATNTNRENLLVTYGLGFEKFF